MESIRGVLNYLTNLEWSERVQFNCKFCDRANFKTITGEDNKVIAIENRRLAGQYHWLIMPTSHVRDIEGLSGNDVPLLQAMDRMKNRLIAENCPDVPRSAILSGYHRGRRPLLGKIYFPDTVSIHHLHLHVIVRPRLFMWLFKYPSWLPLLWRSDVRVMQEVQRLTERRSLGISPARQGVHLYQVNPDKNEVDTDIDIIAIHGLDTKSPDTWIWKNKQGKKNWISDPDMLPKEVGAARIFTCNWPADLLQPEDLVQKTIDEYARLLLDGIRRGLLVTNATKREDRPIFFIASCLGGIILAKALADHAEPSLQRATRGIVFLATPFRGTSLQDVATWAKLVLRARAFSRGQQKLSALLDYIKGPKFQVWEVVSRFTGLYKGEDYHVFNFYEKGKTSLPRKIFPCLPNWLSQEKLLVNESSATLDIVSDPLPLDRRHVMMNKFKDSYCADYKKVIGKIIEFLGKIRKGTPLAQADDWIRKEHYTADRLKIDRLSGNTLSMDCCYINLAIVEQSDLTIDQSGEENSVQKSSQFTLAARLKVQEPDKKIQVTLPTLFKPRKWDEGDMEQPRRILIQGRAGVGKTTLCKKMVYDFVHQDMWSQLFDRILWVPLRNLKQRQDPEYNLEKLFRHQYFGQHSEAVPLAKALQSKVSTEGSRTLFILDGLDEVSQELDRENPMFGFLQRLLGQANVIVTSRPHATLPSEVDRTNSKNRFLRLETIGFNPDQVERYIEHVFTDPEKIDKVQSFLQGRWLIQSLVRIPILLDALCYTWDEDFQSESSFTMTRLYEKVELKLWQMDLYRQRKGAEKELKDSNRQFIEQKGMAYDSICLLEVIAFSGLYNNIQEFTPEQRQKIYESFDLPVSAPSVEQLCFLRTSNALSERGRKDYHFLHLTFQEYFAARYIVRQWNDKKDLTCLNLTKGQETYIAAADFVKREKYNPGYDILWRFVTGQIHRVGGEERLCEFFGTIDAEPRDLLGPVHQRLVMHCLSEADPAEQMTKFTERRRKWESQLSQWLLFECKIKKRSQLAGEMEFPEQILKAVLRDDSEDIKISVLRSLNVRLKISPEIMELAASWLRGKESAELKAAAFVVFQRPNTALSAEILEDLAERLEDDKWHVKVAAIKALGGQSNLSEKFLEVLAKRLEDNNWQVKAVTIEALGGQSNLSNELLKALMKQLKAKRPEVRAAAVKVLGGQSNLSIEFLEALVQRLKDKSPGVKAVAANAFNQQSALSKEVLRDLTQKLKDPNQLVRLNAVKILTHQSTLPEELLEDLTKQLEDPSPWIKSTAAEALTGQSTLRDKLLETLIKKVKDPDSRVRGAAIKTLSGQSTLSENFLEVLARQLEDNLMHIRAAAARALGEQSNLSSELLEALAERLKDKNSTVRVAVTSALGGQSNLSDKLLKALVKQVREDNNKLVKGVALNALARQSTLSEELIRGLIQDLENTNLQKPIIKIFGRLSNLSKDSLQDLKIKSEDLNWSVRVAAVKVLGGQSTLSEKFLEVLAKRLEDDNWQVKITAIEALGGQSNLSNKLLKALTERLKDDNRSVKFAAVDALDQYILRRPEDFCSILLNIDDRSFESYYEIWLERSFHGYQSWYRMDTIFYVSTPQGIKESFECSQENQDQLSNAVQAAQRSLGIPLLPGV